MLENQKQDLEKEIRRMRRERILHLSMLVSYVIVVQLEAKFNTFDRWPDIPPTLSKVIFLGWRFIPSFLPIFLKSRT